MKKPCFICSVSFKGNTALFEHLKEVHDFKPFDLKEIRNIRESVRIKCLSDSYKKLASKISSVKAKKKPTHLEIINGAVKYIKSLEEILNSTEENPPIHTADDVELFDNAYNKCVV